MRLILDPSPDLTLHCSRFFITYANCRVPLSKHITLNWQETGSLLPAVQMRARLGIRVFARRTTFSRCGDQTLLRLCGALGRHGTSGTSSVGIGEEVRPVRVFCESETYESEIRALHEANGSGSKLSGQVE